MFIVLEGCIEIFRENKRISLMSVGDYFGEMAIIDDMPRSAGARGHQDSFVFEINKTQFKDILEASPPVVKAFLLTISQRSRVGLDIIDAGYMELIQSEERYRTMVQTISDIIIQVDNSGNISFINSSISHLGYDPTELIGKPLAQIIEMPDIADEARGILTRRVRDRATTNGEVNFIVKPDNSLSGLKETIPYLVNSHGMWDVKNDLVIEKNSPKSFQGTLLLAKNISQLKNEEMLLRKRKDQLEKAIREAESANGAKSEFFSIMSHELRTPLNAILGFSQLLSMDVKEPLSPNHRKNVEAIFNGGKHLHKLINELLDLSRIESGEMTLSLENVQVKRVLDELLELVRPLVEEKDIHIINGLSSESEFFVWVDITRFKQVLLNLISNAIKYNRKGGGSILFECDESPLGRVRISVKDTGIGIKEEKMKTIFKPFARINRDSAQTEGTGIGLAITKNLTELMDGSIEAESVFGEGSCFTVHFPLGNANERLEKELPAKTSMIKGKSEYTLLYIEDNPDNLYLVSQILLDRPNIRLLSAPQATIGIELARAHQPDLILMDINLPEISGTEALKHLQTYDETREIPVIAISAHAGRFEVKKALAQGFKDYIVKPIDVPHFLSKIDKMFG